MGIVGFGVLVYAGRVHLVVGSGPDPLGWLFKGI